MPKRFLLFESPDKTLVSLVVVTLIGFYSKFYTGPAALWVNNSLSGVFYEIFWCLLFFFFLKKCRPGIIAACVLTVTCLLEFLQLWHPPFLVYIRSSFLGSALLGTTFVWTDFLYYSAGCALGWLWMHWLQQ